MVPEDTSTRAAAEAQAAPDRPAAHRPGPRLARAWLAFADWRRSRPFWAGVLLIAAGLELLLIPLPVHSLGPILHIGTGGVLGIGIGALLMTAAVALWLTPQYRHFWAILATLLSIAALVGSNLGGFLIGTLLGVLGGSLGFAWAPLPGDDEDDEDDDVPGPGEAAADDREPASAGLGPARSRPALFRAVPVPLMLAMLLLAPGAVGVAWAIPAGHPAAARPADSGTPDPSSSASPSPDPSPSPSPDPSASPSPSPTATASGSASASPSPSASGSAAPPAPTSSSPPPTATAPAGLTGATQASSITATSATLDGLTFDGVATVNTATGTEKALEFSMSSLTLDSADLSIQQSGSPETISATEFDFSGNVTLFTASLSGTLDGVSVTFTPADPPPTVPSDLTLTNITATQLVVSAGSFSVTGLQISG